MKDRTLRRSRFHTPTANAVPFSAAATPADDALLAREKTPLSPRAQKWYVMATARHFREHYLAELAYNELRDMTVAIIRPYLAQAQANEAPFEIRVDGRGHTTIVRLEEELLPSHSLSWLHRLFVALLILAALTSGALALFL